MNLQWTDIVGLIGVLLILLAFLLLQIGKLRGDGPIHQLLNAFGAAAVLVSLWHAFNLSVLLMESAWLLISMYGFARGVQLRREARSVVASRWPESTRPRSGPR